LGHIRPNLLFCKLEQLRAIEKMFPFPILQKVCQKFSQNLLRGFAPATETAEVKVENSAQTKFW